MRTRGSELLITKGCKQDLACVNNLIQNPRDQGEGPSQCNLNGIHSKCECCCFTTECNADLCPYPNELPTCPSFVVENVVFRGVDLDGSILPGGVAAVSLLNAMLTFAHTLTNYQLVLPLSLRMLFSVVLIWTDLFFQEVLLLLSA